MIKGIEKRNQGNFEL